MATARTHKHHVNPVCSMHKENSKSKLRFHVMSAVYGNNAVTEFDNEAQINSAKKELRPIESRQTVSLFDEVPVCQPLNKGPSQSSRQKTRTLEPAGCMHSTRQRLTLKTRAQPRPLHQQTMVDLN